MSEASKKLSIEELNERVNQLKQFTEKSLGQVEDLARKRPVEVTAMSFSVGIVLGLILGAAIAKR